MIWNFTPGMLLKPFSWDDFETLLSRWFWNLTFQMILKLYSWDDFETVLLRWFWNLTLQMTLKLYSWDAFETFLLRWFWNLTLQMILKLYSWDDFETLLLRWFWNVTPEMILKPYSPDDFETLLLRCFWNLTLQMILKLYSWDAFETFLLRWFLNLTLQMIFKLYSYLTFQMILKPSSLDDFETLLFRLRKTVLWCWIYQWMKCCETKATKRTPVWERFDWEPTEPSAVYKAMKPSSKVRSVKTLPLSTVFKAALSFFLHPHPRGLSADRLPHSGVWWVFFSPRVPFRSPVLNLPLLSLSLLFEPRTEVHQTVTVFMTPLGNSPPLAPPPPPPPTCGHCDVIAHTVHSDHWQGPRNDDEVMLNVLRCQLTY